MLGIIKGLLIGILVAGNITNTTNKYVITRGTVEASWEEPEGICTSMNTEYGRGCLLNGYYSDDTEYIVIYDTNNTQDYYYDDEIVQVIPIEK